MAADAVGAVALVAVLLCGGLAVFAVLLLWEGAEAGFNLLDRMRKAGL